jgi:hypothetical protein
MIRMALTVAVALACTGPACAQGFKLESPDVKPNATIAEEQVFNGFGCAGKNVSPALKWSGAPAPRASRGWCTTRMPLRAAPAGGLAGDQHPREATELK